MIGDSPHRLIQGAIRPPGHHVNAYGAHVAVHGRTLQRPHPVDQWVLGAAKRGALQYVDRHHYMTATTQVDQRQREFGIEQRGEPDDDRTRRNCRPRSQWSCGALEFIASVEDGVDTTAELPLP